MKALILLILLQFSLFRSNNEPVSSAKVYIEDAKSNEVVAFVKLGQNGNFLFSNLDPGVYFLSVEIPDKAIKDLDRRSRSRFGTDILVGYNSKKKTIGWQRKDGLVHLAITKTSKVADLYDPRFELAANRAVETTESEKQEQKAGFFERLKQSNPESVYTSKVTLMQFTVANMNGSLAGSLSSVSERDFHRMMVGTGKITLENQGLVQVIVRE